MRYLFVTFFICLSTFSFAQQQLDTALARSLGADKYGMKQYTFVVLKTGSNTSKDSRWINEKFKGHMENMAAWVKDKKLVIAGPFSKNADDFRGLFILNTADTAEARKWLQADPAIAAGLLKPVLYPWYGSAALPLYLPFHDLIQQENF